MALEGVGHDGPPVSSSVTQLVPRVSVWLSLRSST